MADKLPWGLKSDGLAPNSMTNLTENKLKAFNVGTMNIKKGMTKKEQDELRKKREKEETEAAYKDFVESFSSADKGLNRAWVKGGLAHGKDSKMETSRGKLYRPKSKMAELAASFQSTPQHKKDDDEAEKRRLEKIAIKKKQQDKKKSNLELFKEELKVIQEERQERRKIKQSMGIVSGVETPGKKSRFEPAEEVATGSSIGIGEEYGKGSYNYESDMQTTNLYLGNINPKMSEPQLCEIFGRFGPLASVKIMWPRSEEERARGRNCGFVAYMNRKDGERAMSSLQGTEVMSFEMKLGWGKAVPIPPHPVYIPPALAELTLPPPPSGLPFNAQPRPLPSHNKSYGSVPPPGSNNGSAPDSKTQQEIDKTLANAVVKVVIPTERSLLSLIHRTIEFVVREGPMFEAMIMNRELNNPMFRFLFENQSPAHVYYRWKLFTILQGDSAYKWRTDEFRMFKGGSLWRPPKLSPYTKGMPDDLVNKKSEPKKGQLTESQRDRLEDILRDLTPERVKIGDAMIWCLEHAESAEEIVECITESLSILETPVPKKIARLFLISDILNNCSAKVPNASFFRKYFESKLAEIFKDVRAAHEKIEARLKAEQFKQKVMCCFRAWEDWAVYTNDHLINLQNIFLGLIIAKPDDGDVPDIDGAPIEDVDGLPIDDVDGIPIENGSREKDTRDEVDTKLPEDVDGLPLGSQVIEQQATKDEPEVDKKPSKDDKEQKGFKYEPSKWESVDESLLEAQAVTTSKWELLEQQDEPDEDIDGEDLDGQPLDDDVDGASYHGDDDSQGTTPLRDSREASPYQRLDTSQGQGQRENLEERRAKLREIEMKVVKYQDEVEAGRRSRKSGMTFAEQVEHYRKKLLAKEEDREREDYRDRVRREEREKVKEWERARDRERERRDKERERQYDKEREYEKSRDRGERERDYEHEDTRRVRESERSFRGGERYENSPSSEEYTAAIPSLRVYVDRSVSRSPVRQVRRGRSKSLSPPSAYREESPPSSRKKHRSSSKDRKSQRMRGGSPKKSKRSRSRSRSRSPIRHRHKHKKSRH